MYKDKGLVYADAFRYLHYKKGNIVGFAIPGNIEDFEEKVVTLSDLNVKNNMILFNRDLLGVIPEKLTHSEIKKKIIKSRYTNDDQIAVMLNNNSEEYTRMQKWREFATAVADKFDEVVNGVEDATIVE
jgi:hypothetical protein